MGNEKKTYFCVMSEFYDYGEVKAVITTRYCKAMPKNSERIVPGMSAYMTWFDNFDDAKTVLDAVRLKRPAA